MRVLAGFAVAFVLATGAGAGVRATPSHYEFSFALDLKPDYVKAFPTTRVTGDGAGSFSITNRQIDRDGTFFWHLTGARGSVSLSSGGRLLARASVVGGTFGTEKATGGFSRNVLLQLRITSSPRFRCRTPAATLALQDLPQVKGNLDSIQFHACGADLQWAGKPPALVVKVTSA